MQNTTAYDLETLPPHYAGNIQFQSPATFELLKKEQLCQTNLKNKKKSSSLELRKMAYEALRDCGHPYPELIMITNETRTKTGPIGSGIFTINGLETISLHFDESTYFSKKSYGIKRIIIYHEAWHIVAHHYDNETRQNGSYYLILQEQEREADHMAVIKAACRKCARECAAFFFGRHAKLNRHSQLKKYAQCSLKDLDTLSTSRIAASLPDITGLSKARVSCHPLDIERALRIYLDSRELESALCAYHQKHLSKKKLH